jgi:hypothetical protein
MAEPLKKWLTARFGGIWPAAMFGLGLVATLAWAVAFVALVL